MFPLSPVSYSQEIMDLKDSTMMLPLFYQLLSRQRLKELMGYTLELKSSQIRHEQASWGLFIDGEAYGDLVIAHYADFFFFRCNINLKSLLTKNKEYVVSELRGLFLQVLGMVLNNMWCHKQKPSGCRFCEPITNPDAGKMDFEQKTRTLLKLNY
uniref:Uncharacterized protein n=1 Tax=Helianthus annuus TaxID=4232 RepID=A0A251VS12_HELAN